MDSTTTTTTEISLINDADKEDAAAAAVAAGGGDLTIWRSTTSTRLRQEEPSARSFYSQAAVTAIRIFLAVFTVLSFALATAPIAQSTTEDATPLDQILNVSAEGKLIWSPTLNAFELLGFETSKIPSVLAVPALFGSAIRERILAIVTILDREDGCKTVSASLPEIAMSSLFDIDGNETLPWFAMIPRGNCSFDAKVFNAQSAGYSGVIIYNPMTRSPGEDIPVRMSPNGHLDDITATAMFLTHAEGRVLISSGSPLLLSITPDDWPSSGWKKGDPFDGENGGGGMTVFFDFLSDLVFLIAMVIIFFFGFTVSFVCLSMLRNYWVHGRLFVIVFHSVRREEDATEHDDLLEKITIPTTIFQESLPKSGVVGNEEEEEQRGEAASMTTGGACCAICIDDLVPGNRIRRLPCKHEFHDICIDPWLLNHNRLCPTCKRDVLAKQTSAPMASVTTESVPSATPAVAGSWMRRFVFWRRDRRADVGEREEIGIDIPL